MMTNCVNCGAPLEGKKCKYCGTEYKDHGVVASFGENDWMGTLKVGEKEFPVYIANIEITTIEGANAGRTIDGRLNRDIIKQIHKFTLVEM